MKNRLIYCGLRVLDAALRALPAGGARRLMGALGRPGGRLPLAENRRVRENLVRYRGKKEGAALAAGVFPAWGRNLADMARGPAGPAAWEGREYLATAAARGRGVIVLGAHFGAFELLPAYLARDGFPLTVAAAALYDSRLEAWIQARRRAAGVTFIPAEGAARRLCRALRNGQTVGVMADLFFPRLCAKPQAVEFFGRPYRADPAPYRLAALTGAALVPVFIRRGPAAGCHAIRICRPVCAAQEYFRALEELVRVSPAEWAWMHPYM